jgi:hypothetical protein
LVQNIDFLVGIAHIAGIFVGFGALISTTRKGDVEVSQLSQVRSVVTVGLLVIVGALIPIGFDLYGFSGHILWFICSLIFFLLNWVVSILSLLHPENRELMITQMRGSPLKNVAFWLFLEVPLQASLILTIIGLYPVIEPALYTTALLFNLFEAAFALVQLVYLQGDQSNGERSSTRPPHI